MRGHLISLCAAVAAALILAGGCGKHKMVTTPCDFQVTVDDVKGSKIHFTIVPGVKDAYYTFFVVGEGSELFSYDDQRLTAAQMEYMSNRVSTYQDQIGTFCDLNCYTGTRSLKATSLQPDQDHYLCVFQVNPKTNEAIGPLYRKKFHTKAIDKVDLTFSIKCSGDKIRIIPSDNTITWFWEYEDYLTVGELFASPISYFYMLTDIYQEYDFLGNLMERGPAEWVFSRDDPSLKDNLTYYLTVAGIDDDGEFTTDVYVALFERQDGQIVFDDVIKDMPVEYE